VFERTGEIKKKPNSSDVKSVIPPKKKKLVPTKLQKKSIFEKAISESQLPIPQELT